MKKRTLLLPLLAGFLLASCEINVFGKVIKLGKDETSDTGSGTGTGGGGGGAGGGGGGGTVTPSTDGGGSPGGVGTLDDLEIGADDFVMDFSVGDKIICTNSSGDTFINVDDDMTFTYDDVEFSGCGCYDAGAYFMMKSKDGSKLAYFGNTTPFSSPIKEAIVVLNSGDSISTNTVYRVNINKAPATVAFTTGGQQGSASKEANVTLKATSTDSDAYYFSVATNLKGSSKYNGQVVKVVLKF